MLGGTTKEDEGRRVDRKRMKRWAPYGNLKGERTGEGEERRGGGMWWGPEGREEEWRGWMEGKGKQSQKCENN